MATHLVNADGSHGITTSTVSQATLSDAEWLTIAPRYQPQRPFRATGLWNTPLPPDVPIRSDSAQLIADLLRQIPRTLDPTIPAPPDGSGVAWIERGNYSTCVYEVPATQPTVTVRDERGRAIFTDAYAAVPIPSAARIPTGLDKHLVIWQPDTDRMWEFWHMRRDAQGWIAGHGGAMQNVSANAGVFDAGAWVNPNPDFCARDWWGATATALPLLGGLIRIHELQAGHIPHALAGAIPDCALSSTWLAPARRSDGNGKGLIPQGARLRLPARLQLSTLGLSPLVRMIAEAVQTYGWIIRDATYGSANFYGEIQKTGQPDPWLPYWSNLTGQLHKFPWSALQVVDAGAPA